MRGQSPVNSWRKWFCFPLASNCHPLVKISYYLLEKSRLLGTAYQTRSSPQYLLEKSRLLGTAYQTRSLPAISLGEVAFTWYCVPNTLSPRNISWRSRVYLVLRTKHALPRNISWRSRLVWSRARDWKSRNRQKRFKSSNLFFSANT